MPEYLNKPIVKQRQKMVGQLNSLSKAASVGRISARADVDTFMPMQISSKVLTEAASFRQLPLKSAITSADYKFDIQQSSQLKNPATVITKARNMWTAR